LLKSSSKKASEANWLGLRESESFFSQVFQDLIDFIFEPLIEEAGTIADEYKKTCEISPENSQDKADSTSTTIFCHHHNDDDVTEIIGNEFCARKIITNKYEAFVNDENTAKNRINKLVHHLVGSEFMARKQD